MEIQDPVHGTFLVDESYSSIIRTSMFQRLKSIKQLGSSVLVFTTATHTRYDHCIGTYFQAKKMLQQLESTISYKLPVYIGEAVLVAALLHDVAHGPFSHLWENCVAYCHEENAAYCVDAIFNDPLTSQHFCSLKANNNFGLELVKALILGDPSMLPSALPAKYLFVFEIVNNKQCKLDVDKWDYLMRDHYYLKDYSDVDLLEIDDVFENARVSPNGERIEYRYEDQHKIYKVFKARWKLHVDCYQTPLTLLYNELIYDMVTHCEGKIAGKKLSEISAKDAQAFLMLTDQNVIEILKSDVRFKYLMNRNLIEQVESYADNIVVSVSSSISPPGVEMPPDDHFKFYGDASKIQPFERCYDVTIIEGRFYLKLTPI